MRGGVRCSDLYILLAMLSAGASGRTLDAAGALPGVAEGEAVRDSHAAWLTCLVVSTCVAALVARRWTRTRSLRAAAVAVVPAQMLVFVSTEAVTRVANGRGPLDPDALVGACLQAALALVLLLGLAVAWRTVLRCGALVAPLAVPDSDRARRRPTLVPDADRALPAVARGPPRRPRSLTTA